MNENVKALANAIVLQAIEDYLTLERKEDREEIESFFRSDWFSELCDIDPEVLIRLLKEEDSAHGIERCEKLFESGELF